MNLQLAAFGQFDGEIPTALPHDNLGNKTLAVVWSLTVISLLFLCLRLYCKYAARSRLRWDEFFLIASWITDTISAILNTLCRFQGLGKHIYDVGPSVIPRIVFLGNVSSSFSITATAWSKTSFAVTLLYLSQHKWMTWTVWMIIGSMNIVLGVTALCLWIQCRPIEKVWNITVDGLCWDQKINVYLGIFSGVYSGCMDIVLALLPWVILMRLQIKTAEKIGIAISMSIGVFAGIIAFFKSANIMTLNDGDVTYALPQLVIWSAVEVSTTIIAASIPMLRRLIANSRRSTSTRTDRTIDAGIGGTRHMNKVADNMDAGPIAWDSKDVQLKTVTMKASQGSSQERLAIDRSSHEIDRVASIHRPQSSVAHEYKSSSHDMDSHSV